MLQVGATKNKPLVATGNSDSANSITLPNQSECAWLQPDFSVNMRTAVGLFRFEVHQVLMLRTVITQDRMFVAYLTTLNQIYSLKIGGILEIFTYSDVSTETNVGYSIVRCFIM
jgi:hypothetical protein